MKCPKVENIQLSHYKEAWTDRWMNGWTDRHIDYDNAITTVDPEIFARLYFREIRVSDLFAS